MKGDLMREKFKNKLRILVIAALILILLFPFCLYAVLYFGFPPVIGNLLSAGAINSYAAQVYPDWISEGNWAGYNLVDDGYNLSFTEGAQSHWLGYSKGVVQDEEREAALRAELEIDKTLRLNGSHNSDRYYVYWSARWSAKQPEQPLISVDVTFYDSSDAPIPDEAAIREKMADRGMEVYHALSPVTPIHTLSVRYCHQGIKEEGKPGNYWHIIRTHLPEGTALIREEILSGELTVT